MGTILEYLEYSQYLKHKLKFDEQTKSLFLSISDPKLNEYFSAIYQLKTRKKLIVINNKLAVVCHQT
jgi:hypothetical protein